MDHSQQLMSLQPRTSDVALDVAEDPLPLHLLQPQCGIRIVDPLLVGCCNASPDQPNLESCPFETHVPYPNNCIPVQQSLWRYRS